MFVRKFLDTMPYLFLIVIVYYSRGSHIQLMKSESMALIISGSTAHSKRGIEQKICKTHRNMHNAVENLN